MKCIICKNKTSTVHTFAEYNGVLHVSRIISTLDPPKKHYCNSCFINKIVPLFMFQKLEGEECIDCEQTIKNIKSAEKTTM